MPHCSAHRLPQHRCLPVLMIANEAILSSFPVLALRMQEVKVELAARC